MITDILPEFAGPLAGLQAALPHARHDLVATVPCDCPYLPLDLVARLRQTMEAGSLDIAVAKAAGRVHPVFCLCRRSGWPSLDAFLAAGGRRFERWYARLRCAETGFDDQTEAFRNINTPGDLAS